MRELWLDLLAIWDRFTNVPRWKVAVSAVLLLAILVLAVFGRDWHRAWKVGQLEPRLNQWYEEGQYDKAVLGSRQLLALRPEHYEANRIMADLALRQGSPAALEYWRRVVELRPDTENQLGLARAALLLGQIDPARDALRAVGEAERETVAFHSLAFEVATALNLLPQVEFHLSRLALLLPEDATLAARLARTRLFHPDGEIQAGAVEKLHLLARQGESGVRVLAKEGLVIHYLNANPEEALDPASALFDEEQLSPSALWLLMEVFHGRDDKRLAATIGRLQKMAEKNPSLLNGLVDWHLREGDMRAFLHWLETLPADVPFFAFPVGLARARVLLAHEEWETLRRWLESGPGWGPMDYLRLAYLSRMHQQMGQPGHAAAQWRAAVLRARLFPEALRSLVSQAAAWGMEEQAVELAWETVERFPLGSREIFGQLEAFSLMQGDTENLVRLFDLKRNSFPEDAQASAAWATLSVLRNQNMTEAVATIDELLARDPGNPHLVTAAALADFRSGDPASAVSRVRSLSAESLTEGNRPLYFSAMLAEAGEVEEAGRLLAKWEPPERLLPEEEALWRETRARL